ncbi:MAG: type IX secretion system sortase PorU, partial [Bacteroidota bacterium]|nr:type IX secretion system sortase PorU [Bacteroidota bacterium]MDX5431605.1 type IX secretion system sortase PorU [Bacteroidota bacterium]MDX5470326.1 type IX secretion system sortase PorU [Bacteroidota bacterium]
EFASPNNGTPTYTTSSFDEVLHQEDEKFNLIRSGRDWFGKEFGRTTPSHTLLFDLPGQVAGEKITLQTRATARCEFNSAITGSVNGQMVHQHAIESVYVYFYAAPYADDPTIARSTFNATGPISLNLTYNRPTNDAKAWLDYAEIIYRRNLETSGQLIFQDARGVTVNGITRYNLTGSGYEVWDVTDPLNSFRVPLQSDGSNQYFIGNSEILHRYIAFKNEVFKTIVGTESNINQNIHGARNVDYVMVAHPDFMAEAKRLADFHKTQNNLNVLVVTPAEVYNEFSSGVPDVSAIRNMMRYFYEKAAPGSEPRYLLLFGDASYDYKNILKINTNYVPTFESWESVKPVGSYCTDDYFGLLDENEGTNLDYSGYLDIGMGRLPVQSVKEAKEMVDKIIRYHHRDGLGEWRNDVMLLADDEDNNIHMGDGIIYAQIIEDSFPEYNVKKVFADAYKQETVGNGQRYPDVVKEVNRAFNDGALIVNYSGHGGEVQLGAEKFVEIPQINAWKGGSKMPLFITATCEFTRFDDPARQSAGELVMLNPNGGGIGLLTTVRLVYQWPNLQLNKNFYINNAFSYAPDKVPALGDLLVKTKNGNLPSVNNRSFVFIGDPAVKLAYPKYNVVATEINSVPVGQLTDTANALSKFTLKGEVRDFQDQKLGAFNGIVVTTIFAPEQDVTTLRNDPGSKVETFKAYTSIVYKGVASVKNGEFSVSFILPRDLPYEIGEAKISFYADNGTEDANGYGNFFLSPKIDPNAVPDFNGPSVRLYMNDSLFIRGGLTDENPNIYARVVDESGINTTGLGIGRDVTAVLDGNQKNAIVLNEYYKADVDDFQHGTVLYPLSGLSEGKHTLSIKVWDVHNNSATATTEFVVAYSEAFAIENLLAYPNPFAQSTTISFEHNQQGKVLDMRVLIYDSKGILVKTITATELSEGTRVNSLVWNPYRNGYSELAPGMYHFKLMVRTEDGKEAEASSRLVYMPNP